MHHWVILSTLFSFLLGVYCVSVSNVQAMYGHTYSKSMDQPEKIANPARGELNRAN